MSGPTSSNEAHPKHGDTVSRTEAGSVALTPSVQEPAVDHGIEESFPASDPVSVSITKVLVASDDAPSAPDPEAQNETGVQPDRTSDQPAGPGGREPSSAAPPLNPGDEAVPGTPGTGETFCPVCGGSGVFDGVACKACGGSGQVTVGIGGA